jgi:hypothetical protein
MSATNLPGAISMEILLNITFRFLNILLLLTLDVEVVRVIGEGECDAGDEAELGVLLNEFVSEIKGIT